MACVKVGLVIPPGCPVDVGVIRSTIGPEVEATSGLVVQAEPHIGQVFLSDVPGMDKRQQGTPEDPEGALLDDLVPVDPPPNSKDSGIVLSADHRGLLPWHCDVLGMDAHGRDRLVPLGALS